MSVATRTPYNLGLSDSCHGCEKRDNGFFCNLTDRSLKALDQVSFVSSYPPNAVLFVEGQSPRGVFVVCKGQAKLSVVSEDGRTLIIKIAGPGEVLGLGACVSGRPYEATVETLGPCEVNFVKTDDFRRLLQSDSDICMHAALQMSLQYNNACRELRWVGLSRSADWRVASLLLVWLEERGTPGPVPGFKMSLTHEEVAQMVGTTRETVTRVLTRFRKQGFIQVRGATILLCNMAALQDISGRAGAVQPRVTPPAPITRLTALRPSYAGARLM
jgi:CRP/FNR family transcriptional regulator, cyclic AMP receptor protein